MISRSMLARLSRSSERLREALDEPLTVAEVAREASLSTGEFIRRFAAVFGETPHRYRINARMERARLLLTIEDLPVTEVCFRVGFSSVGSFSDRFARSVGERPSVYRQRIRSQVRTPDHLNAALHPGCLQLMAGAFAAMPGLEAPRRTLGR